MDLLFPSNQSTKMLALVNDEVLVLRDMQAAFVFGSNADDERTGLIPDKLKELRIHNSETEDNGY